MGCADFVEENALELSLMAQKLHCPASRLMGLEAGSYAAWCVDEAMFTVMLRLAEGRKLRPKKSEDNWALLKQLGL